MNTNRPLTKYWVWYEGMTREDATAQMAVDAQSAVHKYFEEDFYQEPSMEAYCFVQADEGDMVEEFEVEVEYEPTIWVEKVPTRSKP